MVVFFFARNSFPSQNLKRIGEGSITRSVCEDNQYRQQCDTVRRLHCCIYDRSQITGVLNTDTNRLCGKTEPTFLFLLICLSLLCVHYIYRSNLKSLTTSKHFATVDLKTILRRQFVGKFVIDLSIPLSSA